MISCSHWGMFFLPQQVSLDLTLSPLSYDSRFLHGCYQHLNFGPYLS